VTLFMAIAAAMVVVAIGCVLVPLLVRRAHAGPAPEAANLDILRDQLAELEADVARGVLPRERYEQARADLERRVLEEAQGDPAPASAPQPASAWTAAALAAAIPIGALALYLAIGTPSALSPGAEPQHEMTRKRVEQMVARLAARLEKAPEDPEGWRVLGRAYAVLGRHPEAARAYERAAKAPDAAASGRVAGRVSLAQGLAARAAPTHTVFIFARADGGPPMPLAVLRKQVRDLPLEFTLDDSMAMAPSLKLSYFAEVVIGARVSRSGGAAPQSGDLQGVSKPVKVGATGVTVVIDTALP